MATGAGTETETGAWRGGGTITTAEGLSFTEEELLRLDCGRAPSPAGLLTAIPAGTPGTVAGGGPTRGGLIIGRPAVGWAMIPSTAGRPMLPNPIEPTFPGDTFVPGGGGGAPT